MIVASLGHLQSHLELNCKTGLLLGVIHEYKFECILGQIAGMAGHTLPPILESSLFTGTLLLP